MGLENRDSGNYFTILSGKFCQRVDQNTDGATPRVNKLGNTVYEMFYDSFTGKLLDIKVKDGSYGKSWVFIFQDDSSPILWNLQLSYSNSYATALLKMLPNIDLESPIKLSPSQKVVDGKTQSSLFINQNGKTIKHAYTRENPNGLPDLEEKTVKGQTVWDDTLRLEYLFTMINRDVLPKLKDNKVDNQESNMTAKDSVEKLAEELSEEEPF